MMKQLPAQIVRARSKPLDQMPAWALCCDEIRQLHSKEQQTIVKAKLPAFSGVAECKFCGRTQDVKIMKLARRNKTATVICIELYDLDEGA